VASLHSGEELAVGRGESGFGWSRQPLTVSRALPRRALRPSAGFRDAAIKFLLRLPVPGTLVPPQHSLARPACSRFSVGSSSAAVVSSSGTGCGCVSFRIELAMAFTFFCPVVCGSYCKS
jgi:hypothetical protein